MNTEKIKHSLKKLRDFILCCKKHWMKLMMYLKSLKKYITHNIWQTNVKIFLTGITFQTN